MDNRTLTIRYQFDCRQAADERRRKAISRAKVREWRERKARPPEGPTTAARMLAVAHFLERGLSDGSIRSFSEAVDLLGVSPSRASQILVLASLAPRIQDGILLREDQRSEAVLRAATEDAVWGSQAGPAADALARSAFDPRSSEVAASPVRLSRQSRLRAPTR